MPDVKVLPCDFPASGPSSLCGMDIGRCPDDHPPSSFPALSGPNHDPNVNPCLSAQGNVLHVGQVRWIQQSERWETAEGRPEELGARLHRSLEDLHWAAQACGLPHTRPANQAQSQTPLEEARNQGPPLIALRVPTSWLFATVDETGDAKRGLKEKLRIQSSKTTEPNKPLRPHALLTETMAGERGWAPGHTAWPGSSRRLLSPEEIKQEALRRLKLQRQNSTPNLALGWSQEAGEDQAGGVLRDEGPWEPGADRRRHSKARAYIPSFEEFKRMRQREKRCEGSGEEVQGFEQSGFTEGMVNSGSCPTLSLTEPHPANRRASTDSKDLFRSCLAPRRGDSELRHARRQPCPESQGPPIRTCPAPGSPLHTLPRAGEGGRTGPGSGSEGKQVCEAQSSCCSSLLLDAATDLSGYGAKLQQMKDGLIGSAIDLLKKSCASEISSELTTAGTLERHEPEGPALGLALESPSGPPVSVATGESGASPGKKTKSSPSCRRSSSDAAYETPESAKAQRECRLRPHFSDPMPTDAIKRKQLEMKIAAAAWGLGHKRRPGENSGQTLGSESVAGVQGPQGGPGLGSEPRPPCPRPTSRHRAKHRWSNMSTDSGVVGLSDEREEREEEEEEEGEGGEEEDGGGRKSAEVERADSGIGPATAKKWKSRAGVGAGPRSRARAGAGPGSAPGWAAHRLCVDCGEREPPSETEARSGACQRRRERLCAKCAGRRTERKEAVLEFVNTECSYGEDLRVIRQEFYLPMQDAGLLAPEQLAVIFSNIQELIEVNEKFTQRLHDSTEQALDQGDEDFLTVCIGEMFLEFVNMLPAFQTYCIHQSTSINMLNSLEKEKELLRIFLDVSQNDNTALRRMNLRSFLMAPLQRVTKYPLLLSRISSTTLPYHPDHAGLREAKSRAESHLEHINMKTKQEGAPWCLRSFRRDSRRNREVIDIEMREMAVRAVGWSREETRFAMEGRLQFCQPSDGQWARKGSKALKFQSLHVILMVTPGRQESSSSLPAAPEEGAGEEVRDAALVLIRDRSNGKFSLFRDPLHLGHCVVSSDPECDDTFELLDIRRDAFVFRGAERPQTRHWFRLVRRYSRGLGSWKKRRNALPNIMINASQSRA